MIGGVVTVLFGVYLLVFPGAGLLSLVWLVGIWAIVFGITSMVVAWRLRGVHQKILQSRVLTSSRRPAAARPLTAWPAFTSCMPAMPVIGLRAASSSSSTATPGSSSTLGWSPGAR